MNFTRKREFPGVDITKIIMAIFVVAIHARPFENVENSYILNVWDVIKEIAVPYFFIASGYFLFLKVHKESDKSYQLDIVKSYGKKILQLYIYWTLIFLPITIWYFANNGHQYYINILFFIRGFFLLGENFYSWPLWYLHSMVLSLVVIYFLLKRNYKIRSIFIISIVVFLIPSLLSLIHTYKNSSNALLVISNLTGAAFSGRLFIGMLYIMIGALFAHPKFKLSINIFFGFILIVVLFQVIKIPFVSSLSFVLLPTTLFFFSLNMRSNEMMNGLYIRKCSTIMYFTHMIVLFLFTLFYKGFAYTDFPYYGVDAFFISVLIPILITPIILKLQNRIVFFKKIF